MALQRSRRCAFLVVRSPTGNYSESARSLARNENRQCCCGNQLSFTAGVCAKCLHVSSALNGSDSVFCC